MTPEPAQPAESPEARALTILDVPPVSPPPNSNGILCFACGKRVEHTSAGYCFSCIATFNVPDAASTARPTERGAVEVEADCARLLAAYLTKEIGRIMHQAEHWAANGKPLAVHHRLMKADDYYQILCLMERNPTKGWKLPFDEIRDDLNRKDMHAPGNYPPSKDLYRYRDPAFVAAALATQPPTGRTMGGEDGR